MQPLIDDMMCRQRDARSFVRVGLMLSKVVKFLTVLIAAAVASLAMPAAAAVTATFTTGGIAEYSGPNANQNDNVRDFSTLGITKIEMSQGGSSWGGTRAMTRPSQ
jgi:hypothetical protein